MQPFKYNPNFNSGSFRHRITIQSYESTQDELGQQTGVWKDIRSLWAMIKTLQGREYFAAAATQSESTVRFVVRYTSGLDESMRIVYKGRVYEIIAPPINDDELNKTLTILAKESR